jgi:hypothetical protein
MRPVLYLVALTVLAGSCSTIRPVEAPAFVTGRYFVEDPSGPSILDRLRTAGPGYVRVVEVTETGEQASGFLEMWVQHCPPEECVFPPESEGADIILSCFPSGSDLPTRMRHVLPYHAGTVWVYDLGRVVYVSAGRDPKYDILFLGGRRPEVRTRTSLGN